MASPGKRCDTLANGVLDADSEVEPLLAAFATRQSAYSTQIGSFSKPNFDVTIWSRRHVRAETDKNKLAANELNGQYHWIKRSSRTCMVRTFDTEQHALRKPVWRATSSAFAISAVPRPAPAKDGRTASKSRCKMRPRGGDWPATEEDGSRLLNRWARPRLSTWCTIRRIWQIAK